MDFIDEVRTLSTRFRRVIEHLETEEATKNALVMPFLQMMGYAVFDPTEVVPEFTADVGTKRGEKVDYAIMQDGQPTILIECKMYGENLREAQISQLVRYFHVSHSHFGILTDGITYRFFTDLDKPNVMDPTPFFEFDFLDYTDPQVEQLKRFTKTDFDEDAAIDAARDLKYTTEIKRVLGRELSNPSDDFIQFMLGAFYEGRRTQAVIQTFRPIIHEAFAGFVNDRIDARLKIALDSIEEQTPPEDEPLDAPEDEPESLTEAEVEALAIIKSIVGDIVDVDRIGHHRNAGWTSVMLLDDDEATDDYGRLVIRLMVRRDYLRFSIGQRGTIPLDALNDLYTHRESIRDAFVERLAGYGDD